MSQKKPARTALRIICVVVGIAASSLSWWVVHHRLSLYAALVARARFLLEEELSSRLRHPVRIGGLARRGGSLELRDVAIVVGAPSLGRASVRVERARLWMAWGSLFEGGAPPLTRAELEDVAVDVRLSGRVEARSSLEPAALQWVQPIRAALEAELSSLRIRRARLRICGADEEEVARLSGVDLTVERKGGEMLVVLEAGRLVAARMELGEFRLRARVDPEQIRVEAASLAGAGLEATAQARVRWADPVASIAGSGEFEATSPDRSSWLAGVTRRVAIGVVAGAERVGATFHFDGPLATPRLWRGGATARLSEVFVLPLGAAGPLELQTLAFELERNPSRLRIENLVVRGAGVKARGRLDLEEHGPSRLQAALEFRSLAALKRLSPPLPILDHLVDAGAGAGGAAQLEIQEGPKGPRVQGELAVGASLLRIGGAVQQIPLLGVRTAFDYVSGAPSSLRLTDLVLETRGGTARGVGRLVGEHHRVELRTDHLDLARLPRLLPGLEAGVVRGRVVLEGSGARPFAALSATLDARDARWRPPTAAGTKAVSVRLRRASGRLRRRAGGGWQLFDMSAEGTLREASALRGEPLFAEGRISGSAAWGREGHHLKIEVERVAGTWLEARLPPGVVPGRVRGSFTVNGDGQQPFREVTGQIDTREASWPLPAQWGPTARLRVARATAALSSNSDGWRLSSVALETSAGPIRAEASGAGEEYQATLELEPAVPTMLAPWLPGLQSGQLRVRAELTGSAREPLASLSGRARLTRARWRSAVAGGCPVGVGIRLARTRFRWHRGGLSLDGFELETSLFRAAGSATHREGVTEWHGRLTSSRVGELLEAFPALAGNVVGGRGSADVALRVSSSGASGHVDARVTDAVLSVTDPGGGQATRHPVRSATLRYQFSPAGSRLDSVQIRGPQLNLDLDARWSELGPLRGSGRFWLTRRYTDEVTKGGRWALWLLGYSRIDTPFELSGSRGSVRLDASIAHGLRWQLLKVAVPDELEAVARGEKPLWSLGDWEKTCGPATGESPSPFEAASGKVPL